MSAIRFQSAGDYWKGFSDAETTSKKCAPQNRLCKIWNVRH